jgi:hypothetical protein
MGVLLMGAVDKNKPKNQSRRDFVVGSAVVLLAPSLPVGAGVAASPRIDLFLKISSILTGIDLDKSYIQLGEMILAAIEQHESADEKTIRLALFDQFDKIPNTLSQDDLQNVLKNMDESFVSQAQKVARIWYTGRLELEKDKYLVLTYDDALVWQACDFTKPPTTCGGPFGYWQHPYSGKA